MSRKKPSTRKASRRSRRRISIGLVAVIVLCGLFVTQANQFQFTQDDAYISLRYARNLVEGNGLVFNPGERVEGYSNFSWTLLLALFLKLGAPAVQTSIWLGVLFGTGAVFFAARLAKALEGRWGPASVASAALVAANPAFALWSTGGLETALFAFLVTAGLERGFAPDVSPRGRLAAPLLLCLAALTRPDGPLLFAAWFLIRTLDTLVLSGPAADPRGRSGLARDALLFVGPLLPYAVWKLAYYGDLLPNTYYAKAGVSPAYVSRGMKYAGDYFRAYGAWGIAPVASLLSLARGGWRSVEARLLAVWLTYAVYVIGIGGDVLYEHRFWLPVLPIGSVLVARGISRATEWLAARLHRPKSWAGAVSVVAALALAGHGLSTNWSVVQDRRSRETNFVLNMTQTGQWLKANLTPGSTVAITTIGAISYYSELNVIDMLGLTDPEIARSPQMIEGLTDTWREIKYNAESILRRRPDVILFSTGVRPSSAAEKALFLYESFFETYRAYYFRSVPQRENTQILFRVRNSAPPVRLTRLEVDDFEFLDEYGDGHKVQSRDRDYAQAAVHFRRSMEIAGDAFPWGKEWLGAALYDLEDPQGLEILREVAASDPYSVVAHTRLADHALRTGDLSEAKRRFEAVRDFDPDDSVPWMGLAEVSRRQGDVENAFEYARESVLRWEGNPDGYALLGNLAILLRQIELAERCYRRALALRPGHEPAQRGLGLLADIRSGKISLDQIR
jgi:tetratricopeptide (TPR) repeat protein